MRTSVRVFADAMELKLQRDDNVKGPWETDNPVTNIDRLFDEVIELKHAMIRFRLTGNDTDRNAAMCECCDVANSAMIVFSQMHPELKQNVRGRQSVDSIGKIDT